MIDFGLHTNMTDDGSVNHDGGLLDYLRLKKMTIQTWSPFQYGLLREHLLTMSNFQN